MNDLENLIERVKSKDEQAVRELYNLTYRKAYILALSFMGNHDKVDDILQNAYISIFNHIDDLKDPSNLFSWVNTIVSNTCKSELRKNKSYSFSDIEDEDKEEPTYKCSKVKVAGIVTSPLYMSIERGTTTLGNGKIEFFVYVPKSNIDSDVYSSIYVKVENTNELDGLSKEYQEKVEKDEKEIDKFYENLGKNREEEKKES